jgi:hypothetical protein
MFSIPTGKKVVHKPKQFIKTDTKDLKLAVDIDVLLTSLGLSGKNSPKEFRSSCPVHGGDNKSAFKFNKLTRTWTCFTHKCNDSYGNDIIGLIMAIMHEDFMGAVHFLEDLVGDTSHRKEVVNSSKFNIDKNFYIRSSLKPPEYVTEESLSIFSGLRSNFFCMADNGGFSKAVLDYFEIAGGFTDKFGVVRDIIPIRNVAGKLLAYSLRDTRLNPPSSDFKYILTENFSKDNTLYNLNNARIFGTELPIIVVEGFKSVWRLHDMGYLNAVSVMGSVVTSGQVELLKLYANSGVVLMFDNDKPGKEGKDLSIDILESSGYKGDVNVVNIGGQTGDSPAEIDTDILKRLLNEYF